MKLKEGQLKLKAKTITQKVSFISEKISEDSALILKSLGERYSNI